MFVENHSHVLFAEASTKRKGLSFCVLHLDMISSVLSPAHPRCITQAKYWKILLTQRALSDAILWSLTLWSVRVWSLPVPPDADDDMHHICADLPLQLTTGYPRARPHVEAAAFTISWTSVSFRLAMTLHFSSPPGNEEQHWVFSAKSSLKPLDTTVTGQLPGER